MIIDKRDTWKYFKNGLIEECQKDEITYQTHVFLQYHIFFHLMWACEDIVIQRWSFGTTSPQPDIYSLPEVVPWVDWLFLCSEQDKNPGYNYLGHILGIYLLRTMPNAMCVIREAFLAITLKWTTLVHFSKLITWPLRSKESFLLFWYDTMSISSKWILFL